MKFTNDKITYFTSCIILIAIYLRTLYIIESNIFQYMLHKYENVNLAKNSHLEISRTFELLQR